MIIGKRTLRPLLFAAIFLPLLGCAENGALRAATDAERLIEQVQSAAPVDITVKPTPEPAVPEIAYSQWRHTDTITAAEGYLTVSVDAEVRMPAAGTLPVVSVSARFFDQAFASKVFNHFFAGQRPSVVTNEPVVKSKEDLRALIALYESYMEQGISEEQTLLTDEELREEIERIEKQIPDAPDAAIVPETVCSDGTMLPDEYWNNDTPEPIHALHVEDGDERLSLRSPDHPNESSVSYLSYTDRSLDQPIFSNSFVPWSELAAGTGDARVPYPYADAVALCEDFLHTAGVTDAALHTAYLAAADGKFAYVLQYTRTVYGHPVALNYQNVRHSDNRWDYESLEFVVGCGGVHSITWNSPTQLGSLVQASPEILSFEEAYAIFSPTIISDYAERTERYGQTHTIELNVRRIELAHVRIRDMGVTDGKAGYYVPAWVFYGTIRDNGAYDTDGYRTYAPIPAIRADILLAINALDGSVIDFDKGY